MASPRTSWPLIWFLWAVGLLAAAQFAKFTLTLGWLAQVYPGLPVAWLVSGVSVTGILFGAIAGFVVARLGARRVVLWAAALSAGVSFIQAVELPFALLMATRFIEGIGHLAFVVALPTMMSALARPLDKPVVMGIWGTFFGVAFAVLALITPYISDPSDMRLMFGLHGAVLLAMVPVLLRVLPQVLELGAPLPNVLALHRSIYTSPRYFAAGLGHGIYASLFIALVAFLPQTLGAMWLLAVLPLANLSGTFVSGFLARLIPASRLSVICFAVSGLLFVVLGLTASPAVAVCALCATGITAGANFAAVPELNATPQDQARANGAMAQIGNVGTFCGTPFFALTVGAGLWGIVAASLVICLFGVLCAGAAYAAARRDRDHAAATPA